MEYNTDNTQTVLPQAPRHVPWVVRALVSRAADSGALFGWMFLSLPSIFFWPLLADAKLFTRDRSSLGDDLITTRPLIITNIQSSGHSGKDEATIYEYHFRFSMPDRDYEGVSYSADHNYDRSDREKTKVGDSVKIDYVASHPETALVYGMEAKPVGWTGVVFLSVFVSMGLIGVIDNWRRGNKEIRLDATWSPDNRQAYIRSREGRR